jgi:hypothetical protein
MDNSSIGADHEIWQCQDGPITVAVDANGCPLDSLYCKIQAGATTLALAAGAPAVITIIVTNLIFARVRGLVMQASQPALVAPGGDGGLLDYVGVTAINILGNEHVSGEVAASRYAHDSTGVRGEGQGQYFRGDLGTAGANSLITVINRSAVAINVWATHDISGKKSG